MIRLTYLYVVVLISLLCFVAGPSWADPVSCGDKETGVTIGTVNPRTMLTEVQEKCVGETNLDNIGAPGDLVIPAVCPCWSVSDLGKLPQVVHEDAQKAVEKCRRDSGATIVHECQEWVNAHVYNVKCKDGQSPIYRYYDLVVGGNIWGWRRFKGTRVQYAWQRSVERECIRQTGREVPYCVVRSEILKRPWFESTKRERNLVVKCISPAEAAACEALTAVSDLEWEECYQ